MSHHRFRTALPAFVIAIGILGMVLELGRPTPLSAQSGGPAPWPSNSRRLLTRFGTLTGGVMVGRGNPRGIAGPMPGMLFPKSNRKMSQGSPMRSKPSGATGRRGVLLKLKITLDRQIRMGPTFGTARAMGLEPQSLKTAV